MSQDNTDLSEPLLNLSDKNNGTFDTAHYPSFSSACTEHNRSGEDRVEVTAASTASAKMEAFHDELSFYDVLEKRLLPDTEKANRQTLLDYADVLQALLKKDAA